MLQLALGSLIVALIAALFGFGGIAAAATDIALIIFYIAAIIFVVALALNFFRELTTPAK